jgi:hypothetical protein
MDPAGLDGLARRLAGRRGRRAFASVAGALAATVVSNAASRKHTR